MVDETSRIVEANNSRGMTQVPRPASCGFSTNQTLPKNANLQDVKIKREPITDVDTVYGTYDEATNCITIIYPGEDDDIKIQESVQEVSTETLANQKDEQMTTPVQYADHLSPYTCHDSMSPSSIHSDDTDTSTPASKQDSNFSDIGYESHGSPYDETISVPETSTLTDLWHESFSELFPSLA